MIIVAKRSLETSATLLVSLRSASLAVGLDAACMEIAVENHFVDRRRNNLNWRRRQQSHGLEVVVERPAVVVVLLESVDWQAPNAVRLTCSLRVVVGMVVAIDLEWGTVSCVDAVVEHYGTVHMIVDRASESILAVVVAVNRLIVAVHCQCELVECHCGRLPSTASTPFP